MLLLKENLSVPSSLSIPLSENKVNHKKPYTANNALTAPSSPADASPMMMPASITPSMTAMILDLKSISKKLAASVPVHAPVPGSGIPTNSSRDRKSTRLNSSHWNKSRMPSSA